MAAPKKSKKKQWFTVLAPKNFGAKELADVPAYAPEDLLNRLVDVSGQLLTNSPRDSSKKYKLQIIETKGDKVLTMPARFHLTESYVQRSARRYKQRFHLVTFAKSKDDKDVKLKLYFLNARKFHNSIKSDLLKAAKENMASTIKELDSSKIFEPSTMQELANGLKKKLSAIYPLNKILITKLSISSGA